MKVRRINVSYNIYSSAKSRTNINSYYTIKNGNKNTVPVAQDIQSRSDLDKKSANKPIYTSTKYPPEDIITEVGYDLSWKKGSGLLDPKVYYYVKPLQVKVFYAIM